MRPFLHGHAAHPDWRVALGLAAAQVDAQRAADPAGPADPTDLTLGWVYLTDAYAPHARALLAELKSRWPATQWVGAVGIGVAASGVEYFDAPGLALMLGALPRDAFRVFSGVRPLGAFAAHTAQVHADPATDDLGELVREMSERTATGYLFGGLAASRTTAWHIADDAFEGGLSGVAFGDRVALVSRVTQGCRPVGPVRRVTEAERNEVLTLDGEPALAALLRDLDADSGDLRAALPQLRRTLVGLSDSGDEALARGGQFGSDTRVRHLIGLDPSRGGIAIGDVAEPGMRLAFCTRHAEAARRDLVRICAEIREELEPESEPEPEPEPGTPPARRIAGAVYVSCSGRGGPHFGAPSAELAIVRHALGDVPLAGFFAAGEIARRHVYGYTGVLTVFVDPHDPEKPEETDR